jgi:hypothetical protein
MPELVTIPISFFEVAIPYERPVFQLWIDRAAVLQGIFDALKPWNPSIDDTEPRNDGKPSEQGILLKLPLKRASFFFGPASCKFSRDDADWGTADETIAILDMALSALTLFGHVVLGKKNTTISLHIQPRTLTFMDVLNPFVPSELAAMESQPVRTMATVAKWENRKVTIDGSGALANGLFLRLERDFDASATYHEIAHQLRHDEEELFKILGIEEYRG